MQFTTTITNAGNVKLGLRKVGQAIPRLTRRRLESWLRVVMKIAVPYNGGTSYSVPLRGYVRTGELGRRTRVESGDNQTGVYGRIVSDAKHSVYVIGNALGEGQAEIHSGFWQALRDVLDNEIVSLLDQMEGDMSDAARMAGAGL